SRRFPARSSEAFSSVRRRSWPRSTSVRRSAAASRTGFRMCWRRCFCSSGPKGCSGREGSRGYEENESTVDSRQSTGGRVQMPTAVDCELSAVDFPMIYREAGQLHATYAQDQRIFPIRQDRIAFAAILLIGFVGIPLAGNDYWFNAILIPVLILSLA